MREYSIPLLISLFAWPAFAGSDDIQISLPNKEVKFSLKELHSKLKSVRVSIDDPVYKKKKSYDGFNLVEVLIAAGFKEGSGGDEIVFTAKDGYAPNAAFDRLKKHRAILVFREHGKSGFEKVAQGKTMVSPAPYYVVWEEGTKLAEEVPWPYQLVKIEVVDFKQKYGKLYPKAASSASAEMKGFLTFKNQCIRCHSINLQGGDLGPELNAPLNITEYWPRDNLKRFIADASSFRYKSKMPPFPHLKEEEIDQLLAYFDYMKGHKIPKP